MDKFESYLTVWVAVPVVANLVLSIVHARGTAGWAFFEWCLGVFFAVLVVTSLVKKSGLGKVSKSRRNTLWLLLLVPIQALLYSLVMVNIQVVSWSASFAAVLIAFAIYMGIFYSIIYGGTYVLAAVLNKGKVKVKK